MTAAGEARVEAGDNRYSVRIRRDEQGWSVAILAPDGREASVRACGDEAEARTYASTVRQHIGWLSERTFSAYYRLSEGE